MPHAKFLNVWPLEHGELDWTGKSDGVLATPERSVSVMHCCVGPPSERSFASLPFSALVPYGAAAGQWPVSGSLLSSGFHQFLTQILLPSLHQKIPLLTAITVPLWYTLASCQGHSLFQIVTSLRQWITEYTNSFCPTCIAIFMFYFLFTFSLLFYFF